MNINTISCFHQVGAYYIDLTFFDVENNLDNIYYLTCFSIITNYLKYSTSAIMKGKEKQIILAVFVDADNKLFYIRYDNITDSLTYYFFNNNIYKVFNLYTEFIYLSYFNETEEFVFSFVANIQIGEFSSG